VLEDWLRRETISDLQPPIPALQDYSAIELFLQRARQAQAGFAPAAAEAADIVRICQLVEGMPLGLELAAPWIRSLSCQEIANEIGRSLDFLTTPLRNVPERHRSLRVVFEQTWRRLPAAEQAVLSRLSVVRGGCTREAAEQVTGATLRVLSSLVDKALLRHTHTGRYELHELIRQFAEAQLQTDPAAVEQAQQRHRDYFIAFLEARTAGVKGNIQKETLVEIKADIDNVRLAWRRAVADRDPEAIERSAECLFVFYLYSSGHYEGQTAFQQAAAAFIEGSESPIAAGLPDELVVLDKQENLVGFLLAGQGYFLARTRDPYTGQTLLERALMLLRRAEPGDRRKEGFALVYLGWTLKYQGRDTEAKPYAEESLRLFSETADPWGEGWSLLLWGNCVGYVRPTEAEAVYKRALTACGGDQSVLGYASHNLGFVATVLGQYTQAKQYIDEAVRIFEELDSKLGLGYAFNRWGELAIPQGEYRQAIQTLQQAVVYFNEARTPVNVAYCLIWLGMAFRLQGDYGQAEQLYRQTLAEVTAMNNQMFIAFCLTGLGCLAYDRGELPRAEQFHQEALDTWQQIGQDVGVTTALGHLGRVLVATGERRHAEARQYFRQALDLATKLQVAPIALDVCVGAAQLLAQAGDVERAVELLTLAEQHEASTFETKRQAWQLLAELMDGLPAEAMGAAQVQGRTLDWQTAARRLIERLAARAVGPSKRSQEE
jgi:tetratricopeptide (TPR) repeat protein